MAVIGTGLVEKGLRSEFFARFQGTPTFFQDLCTRYPSTTDHEHHRWLGSVPQLREWGQGRLAKGLGVESYSVENLKYEATIEVDRDELDDDQTGQIRLRIGELAEYAASHKDSMIESLLNNGHSAGFHSYDGVPFFNAAHVSGDSGEQSNLLTPTAANVDAVSVTEFRAAFAGAVAQMIGYKDDRGQVLRLQPNPAGFIVIVPTALYFTALDALGIALVPATDGLARNVLQGAASRIVPFAGLTDSASWFLCKVDRTIRPFIFQDRMPIEFGAVEQDSESGFLREKFLYGVRARYRITYGQWMYCIKSTLTAAG